MNPTVTTGGTRGAKALVLISVDIRRRTLLRGGRMEKRGGSSLGILGRVSPAYRRNAMEVVSGIACVASQACEMPG